MKSKAKTYHILGAGIAGLAAARFAKEKNPKNRVIIYEAAGHLGGRCYSYEDKELGRMLDNATHVVLGANKNACRFFPEMNFQKRPLFWDCCERKISGKICEIGKNILLSACNTNADEVAKPVFRRILLKLFPFLPSQLKIYFSHNDLSVTFIETLCRFADKIYTGYVLKDSISDGRRIKELVFNKETVRLSENDVVICALDAQNYHKLFKGPEFDFNEITTVSFRTSQPITLALEQNVLGMLKGFSHWVFVNDDIVSVTISDSKNLKLDNDNLARNLWREIRATREQNAPFLPPYKVVRHKQSTIRQDARNNAKRPQTAQTDYANMFLAGDWTVRNFPCCIEGAIISAKRAVKAAAKSK